MCRGLWRKGQGCGWGEGDLAPDAPLLHIRGESMSISTEAARSAPSVASHQAARLTMVDVVLAAPGGTVHALRDVDLDVHAASSLAVTGASGSGKSTLLSVLALVRRPTSGSVAVDGHETSGLDRSELVSLRSSRVGTVFQSFHLEGSLSAVQNVMLPWYFRHGRTARRTAKERALGVLDLLGGVHLADRRPTDMCEEDRQRVAIARALVLDPALVLADEPATSLDRDAADAVAELLLAVPRLTGAAVVLVTARSCVAAAADRVVELASGRVVSA